MLAKIKDFFSKNDRFAKHNAIEVVSIKTGQAVAKMQVQEFHLNGADVVHGGAIFTLADFAFALASNSHNRVSLGINVSINFIHSVKCGTLTAHAKEISKNHKLGSYNVKVYNEDAEVIADFNGMVYRKSDEIVKDR